MKTLFNLKTLLITVFICNLQSTIVKQQSFNLYAQDPELFNHTWYFVNGEFEGNTFFPLDYLHGEIRFTNNNFTIDHTFCEEGGGGSIVEYQNDIFLLEDFFVALVGVCSQPDETEFIHNHYSIYGDYEDTGIANNPFTYTIEPVDTYLQLSITNGDGDWAVYNSVLLSTASFDATAFDICPNPVTDKLFIESQENISQAAVYDIHGKLIKTIRFNPENSVEIDVRHLQNGIYFLKIETESGSVATEKFIKK